MERAFLCACVMLAAASAGRAGEKDGRMAWWREARFGMFIHWGLYAIPAGEWKGQTHYGEWIRDSARIPLEEYDRFVQQFNPVKFDAREWARLARDAGMKYIVVTSKHHDGFCLFDSKYTDFDVMSTPFHRDILKELADACAESGIRLCFYHSIMDWHHPDYLPRRPWETGRPSHGAVMDRYIAHLGNQLRELTSNYGPIGVLWFDGEWESTWDHQRGQALYDAVRAMQPGIIINNRVDVGRSGMAGMTREGGFAGDFGTPEQEIPATGIPGVDWETCMTMNDHWGYNKHNHNWKSSADLIRKLADIASKGGNFLLNVGPTAEGLFPQPCIERLTDIGEWMRVNGESIYGTQASPFANLPWGRCTQTRLAGGGRRLYLHVFDWPKDGALPLPGLLNEPRKAALLANGRELAFARQDENVVIRLTGDAPDTVNSVITLDLDAAPDVCAAPSFMPVAEEFIDEVPIALASDRAGAVVRYTVDGSSPTADAPQAPVSWSINQTTTLCAAVFLDGRRISPVARKTYTRVSPLPALAAATSEKGLRWQAYEGAWDKLPDFGALNPASQGVTREITLAHRPRAEGYGLRFTGWIEAPADDVYEFFLTSDDGSSLAIDGITVIDHDGPHEASEKSGRIALARGRHEITLTYFERSGDEALELRWSGRNLAKQLVPADALFHAP